MRTTKILAAITLLTLFTTTAVHAQPALRSAYFLDAYLYQHQMNPAFGNEYNYISFPALGDLDVALAGNVGVSNFLYTLPGGGLTTFMHESVGANTFLGSLKNKNRIAADVGETILSAGFKAFGGYNTVELNVRSSTSLFLPKELFSFMKLGMTSSNTFYDVGDIGVSSTNYAELSFGHSREVMKNLRVGAKVKVLLGLGQATAKVQNTTISMTDNQWRVQAQGEMSVAVSGLDIPTRQEAGRDYDAALGEGQLISWKDINYNNFGITGGGLAIDLGATYKPIDCLEVSLAFTDIGFVKWGTSTNARTKDEAWTFDGFKEVGLTGDSDNQIGDQLDDLGSELEDFFNFHSTGDTKGKARVLGATMTIGALYTLPFYSNKLKVGFLSTTRIQGAYSWSEGRFSANWYPCKVVDASVNYAISTYGHSFGWVVNIHPKVFNIFIGSDHQFFNITPQFLPSGRANSNVSIGINFTFGKEQKS